MDGFEWETLKIYLHNFCTSSVGIWTGSVILVTCLLGFLFYKYIARNDNYWKDRGIPYAPRVNTFSALKTLRDKVFSDLVLENAKKYGPIFGNFESSLPVISIAEPDLLRDILVKDFNVFSYRRELESGDPVIDSIVSILKGEDWKRVRTIITPAFTSKRMRQMSSIINRCSKTLVEEIKTAAKTGEAIDFKREFGAFTMDVIASSAFGTKIDVYTDPNNMFVTQAKDNFLEFTSWKLLFFFILPAWMIKFFRISFFTNNDFFKEVVSQVVKTRKEQKKRYNDVLQILMDAVDEEEGVKNEDLNDDEEDRFGSVINKGTQPQMKYKKLSQNELLAQCILFFFVGYETSASVLTFLAYSLATNPEWQEKLIEEVDAAFEKYTEMSYDAVRNMKVLDAMISETLRMYPPLTVSERTATEDYKLGETGLIIEKGMHVQFPIYALHFDSRFFEEPEKFDPERFLDPSKSTFPQYAYLPFGAGPRNCLGMRFALLEIKLCITNILRHYRFKVHSSTKVPVQFRKAYNFLSVTDLPLAVEPRTDVS